MAKGDQGMRGGFAFSGIVASYCQAEGHYGLE